MSRKFDIKNPCNQLDVTNIKRYCSAIKHTNLQVTKHQQKDNCLKHDFTEPNIHYRINLSQSSSVYHHLKPF